MSNVKAQLDAVYQRISKRDPNEKEFLQAVTEVFESMRPVFEKDPKYIPIFERMCEPERMIVFRVPWMADDGSQQVNRGFRVQFNSALGPYKGGLRFHPSVNLSIIKFLGFEQTFKNSLTTLMMGAGKGGSDFDPKGKSDAEVMRFCQSFMTELQRHIGPDTDVPAGDMGVGGREIGFLFGQYKRLRNEFTGVLTGKNFRWGGSLIRPEATGYGCVYFAQNYAQHFGESLKGKKCAISGSGNVAQYAAEKLIEFGAIPITFSDSAGYVYEPNGFNSEQLAEVMRIKNETRGRISEYTKFSKTAKYVAGKRPWGEKCDLAFPCATQNEIELSDATTLQQNGCKGVFEGANMPSTNEAVGHYQKHGMWYGMAKAANAGGVAVSGLEMAQDSQRLQWTREEVDSKLQSIMKNIFDESVKAAEKYGIKDLSAGGNIAGFLKVADSMIDQGLV